MSEGVRNLLAVQSQDYAGAKWGLGQRVYVCARCLKSNKITKAA